MAGAQDQPMLFDQAAQGGDPGMVGLNFFDKDGGISPLKARPLRLAPQFIDFEGFGLPSQNFAAGEDEEGEGDIDGEAGAEGRAGRERKAEKLRKEFSKLVLGHDKQIMMEPLSRKSRREA